MDESRPAAVEQDPLPPLPVESAARAVLRCVGAAAVLLFRRRIRLPRRHLGWRVHFADGTTGVVYRETIADGVAALEPCTLLVIFRLRGIRGWAHAAFRAESLLNTPLFVGFPGFVSKLWIANDQRGAYRGLYEWDGPERAIDYARALWRVLALVSTPGSIHYAVVTGIRRDHYLEDPAPTKAGSAGTAGQLWQIIDPPRPAASPASHRRDFV